MDLGGGGGGGGWACIGGSRGAFQAHALPPPFGLELGVFRKINKIHKCSQACVTHQKSKECHFGDAEFLTTSHLCCLEKIMPPPF